MYGMLPPDVFMTLTPEAQAVELAAYRRAADLEAAGLLDEVAAHRGGDWSNPRTATRLRRILRIVARHLRDRGHG